MQEFTAEDLELLSEEERAELEALMEDQFGVKPLDPFIAENWPNEPPQLHLHPIIETIARARLERVRVCISMPPRHGKTVTILRGIIWWLLANPKDWCAYFTYNDKRGRKKGGQARDWAQQCGITLKRGTEDKGEWGLEGGGGLFAGGRGGGLTGEGVHGLFVVDDPYKNRKEADSPVIRAEVWDWFTEVVTTRLEDASVLVVHTRWHPDDLIGRLEKEGGWEIINLPAIAEGMEDVLGRRPGEALWPDRFPLHELELIRRIIHEWSFSALYQGQPRPRGSQLFNGVHYYDKNTSLKGCRVIIFLDPAATEKTRADHSALFALACRWEWFEIEYREEKQGGMVVEEGTKRVRLPVGYVLEVEQMQKEVPEVVDRAIKFGERNYNAAINVEAVGGFKAVPQMLRRVAQQNRKPLRINEVTPDGDKFIRYQAFAAAWNDGRVLVPGWNPVWLPEFLEQMAKVTGVKDSEDDMADSGAGAWDVAYPLATTIVRGSVSQPSRWG